MALYSFLVIQWHANSFWFLQFGALHCKLQLFLFVLSVECLEHTSIGCSLQLKVASNFDHILKFQTFLHIRANVKQEGQRETTNIIKMTVWPESQEFKRIDYGFKLKCTNESSSRISYREALRICRILSSQYELGRFTSPLLLWI